MLKSALSAPARSVELSMLKSFSQRKVRFSPEVLVHNIDEPAYDAGRFPWEMCDSSEQNIESNSDSSDSEESRSGEEESVALPLPYASESDNESCDEDERKERSDDERSEYDSESYEEESEGDEYEEGDESSASESESESENEYQEPKRYKLTTEAAAPFPNYITLTPDYETSLRVEEACSPFVTLVNAASDEREEYTSPRKRSRGEFEEARQVPRLSLQIKQKIVKAFDEQRVDTGYNSENSDYEGELAALSPEALQSLYDSSSASSPSDFGSPFLPEGQASPFSEVEEHTGCSDDELSLEVMTAQRESGTAPRGEWEEEDEICTMFCKVSIEENIAHPIPLSHFQNNNQSSAMPETFLGNNINLFHSEGALA